MVVGISSPGECRFKTPDLAQRRSETPVGIIGVVHPVNTAGVEKQAGTRLNQKLIHLAADVTQIDVGSTCIAHVYRGQATEIDMNIGTVPKASWQVATVAQPPFEQLGMWREDQIVVLGVAGEEFEYLFPPWYPRGER